MARSISVKIPTASLISSIEAKIAEIDADIENYPAKREQYEKDLEAYKTEFTKFVSDFLSKNADRVGYDYDSPVRLTSNYAGRVELQFSSDSIVFPKRPEEPARPNTNSHYGREYTTQKSLLERNLKILRMTSQEEVNASTYGAVMELL